MLDLLIGKTVEIGKEKGVLHDHEKMIVDSTHSNALYQHISPREELISKPRTQSSITFLTMAKHMNAVCQVWRYRQRYVVFGEPEIVTILDLREKDETLVYVVCRTEDAFASDIRVWSERTGNKLIKETVTSGLVSAEIEKRSVTQNEIVSESEHDKTLQQHYFYIIKGDSHAGCFLLWCVLPVIITLNEHYALTDPFRQMIHFFFT